MREQEARVEAGRRGGVIRSLLGVARLGTASWGRASVHTSRTPGEGSCTFLSIRSIYCSSGQRWSRRPIDDGQTNRSLLTVCTVWGCEDRPNSQMQTVSDEQGLVIKLQCFFGCDGDLLFLHHAYNSKVETLRIRRGNVFLSNVVRSSCVSL